MCSNGNNNKIKLLRKEKLENILNNEIKEIKNGNITYKIEESLTTNSLYLRLYYFDVKFTIRISDHFKKCDIDCKNIIVSKNTKTQKLTNSISNTINDLQFFYTKQQLRNINKNKENKI